MTKLLTFAAASLAVAALGLSVAGCARGPAPGGNLMRVEYAGCASVLEGPVCLLAPERRIVLWAEVPPEARMRFRGGRSMGAPVQVQGGQRHTVEVDAGATRLEVEAGASSWSLAMGKDRALSWLGDAVGLMNAQRYDEAYRFVERRVDAAPAEEVGRTQGKLARIELQRGHVEEALRLLRLSTTHHREQGRTFELIDDASVLLQMLLDDGRYDEARTTLTSLPRSAALPAEASWSLSYYGGVLALDTGDLRSALRGLDEARLLAERLGLVERQRAAIEVLAEPLQLLGRRQEAEERLEQLWREVPKQADACSRAQLLNNLGWNRLLIREEGETAEDPRPILDAALVELGECPRLVREEEPNFRLNLALAQLQAGDLGSSRTQLAAASSASSRSLESVLWQYELEARLELAEGNPARALEGYRRLDRVAETTLSWGARWRAAVGQAMALRALERRREALAAFARAEDRLDDESLQVPIQGGREGLLAGREAATRSHIDLLLREGLSREALAVARRSRARIRAALERGERLAALSPDERRAWDERIGSYTAQRQRFVAAADEDWKLSADRLRALQAQREATKKTFDQMLDDAFALLDRERAPRRAPRQPAQGELILAYHPLPRGIAAFAADRGGLQAERLDCPAATEPRPKPTPELGACLFAPFAPRIRAAQRVTLLPFGRLAAIDLHALAFDGEPLIARRPVTWSLDLPVSGAPLAGGPAMALLVGDPRGDLPAARRELQSVRAIASRGASWQLRALEGQEAQYGALMRLLADADLFHFAGHAEFTGRGGWDSALPLAGSAALTVGDILSLKRGPRWVVLSGCETGASSYEAGESLGLAQAFVTRGAQAVVAATRRVADDTTARLVATFYENWAAGLSPDAALQRAQLALRREEPRADWSAFRLLEP
jgi:hypothetical protein